MATWHQFKKNGMTITESEFMRERAKLESIIEDHGLELEEVMSINSPRKLINIYDKNIPEDVDRALTLDILKYNCYTTVAWEYHMR